MATSLKVRYIGIRFEAVPCLRLEAATLVLCPKLFLPCFPVLQARDYSGFPRENEAFCGFYRGVFRVMQSYCGSKSGALRRRRCRALATLAAGLLFGVGSFGPFPAFSAALSWARMASPPTAAARAHKVSFTFIPAEQGRGQRAQGDEDGWGAGHEGGDDSTDFMADSAPILSDSGPVVVGAAPQRREAPVAMKDEARKDWRVSDMPDDAQAYAVQPSPAVRAKARDDRSRGDFVQENARDLGNSFQSDESSEVRSASGSSRSAVVSGGDAFPLGEAQANLRPHRPQSWQFDADLAPRVSSRSPQSPRPPLTVTDEPPPFSMESPSALRPHPPEEQVLVYGDAAASGASPLPSPMSSVQVLRPSALAASPAVLEPSSDVRKKVAQDLSAKILSVEEPSPSLNSSQQIVARPESAPQDAWAQARGGAEDVFSEREVVARSERAASVRPSVARQAQDSSLTFPSEDTPLDSSAVRSVSGGGIMPSMRPPDVGTYQGARIPESGIIKASMPAASELSPRFGHFQDSQASAPAAQGQHVSSPPRALPLGDAKVYEITDVAVDVKGESAAGARDQALAKAQKVAFGQLLERLGGNPDSADSVGSDVLAGLMQSFEVQNERASPSRYLGMFTIQFKPSAVRAWLDQNKIAYSDLKSGPMVVLPVYVNGGKPVLWEERTRWRAAWENNARDSGLVPVIVPDGELDDVSVVSTEDAASGKPDPLKAIAAKYHAAGTAVVTLVGSFDHPASGFSIQMQRVDAMGNAAAPETVALPAQEVGRTGSDAMLALSVKKARQQLEADWRRERSLASVGTATAGVPAVGIKGLGGDEDASQAIVIRLRAIAALPSGAAWEHLRQRMADVSGLPRVELLSLQAGSARVELGVSSTIEDVQAALLDRDIELRQDPIGGGWSLRALQ